MGSHRHQLPRIRHACTLATAVLALTSAAPAQARDCPTGMFIAAAGPDTASALEIRSDGHFRYMLSVGAVDESAEGRWTCDAGTLLLTTMPTPKAPAFRLANIVEGTGEPFSILVSWPNGRGIAGVDFVLEMDSGAPIEDYTQESGWSGDLGGRKPRSISVSEPFYGTASPAFTISSGNPHRIEIILEPNDMGKAAFLNTRVTRSESALILHWRGGELPYVPAADD